MASSVTQLHDVGIPAALVLTETGESVPSAEHDIMTGSQPDGTSFPTHPDNPTGPSPTCNNWTANDIDSYVIVGHSDAEPQIGWGSAHDTTCDPAGLASTAGSGRIYCFAIN